MKTLQRFKPSGGAVVALFAALLCILYVESFHRNAEYRGVSFGDSAAYLCKAERIYGEVSPAFANSPCTTVPIIGALAQQGPAYPIILAPLRVFDDMASAARALQLALYVLGGYLLFRILRDKGFGEPAVGAVLYFAYLPLATYTSFVLTENLAAFLILLFLFLHTRAERTQDFKRYALAIGLTLSSLMLARPAFQYFSLIAILLLAMYYYSAANRARKSAIVLLCTGFFALYGPWLATINSENKGGGLIWQVTGDRSIERSKVESYDLANSGYPRPSGGATSSPSAYDSIMQAPLASVGLRVEKFIRLIEHPAVVYHNEYLIPEVVLDRLHVLLIGMATVGIFFFLRTPANFILAFPLIYTAAIYTGYFSEERRFLLPVMPVVIIIAAYGINLLVRNPTCSPKQKVARTLSAVLLTACGLMFLFGFDGIDLGGGAYLVLASHITGGLVILAACYIYYPVLETREKIKRRLAFVTFVFFVIVVPLVVHAHWYRPWMRWQVVVDKDAHVRQEIRLPEYFAINDIMQANLQIDARYEPRYEKLITVTVNGAALTPMQEARSQHRSLMHAGMRPFLGVPRDTDLPPPDWRLLAIPKELLAGRALDVTISVSENEAEANAIVYGGFFEDSEKTSYYGPRPFLDASIMQQVVRPAHRESLWKYQTTGDIRLFDSMTLIGDTTSTFMYRNSSGGLHEETADLSSYPFRQSGSYNIRLQIITVDGREIIL